MKHWNSNLRGDIWGGLASAVLTIPLSVGFGLFAFSPLGPEYATYGIVAGLWSAVVVSVVGVLLGHNDPVVYAPRSMSMFLVNSSIAYFLSAQHLSTVMQSPRFVLAAIFLMVFIAGLFQVAFGMLRVGTLVKYIPHPVIAGFQNGAAILLFLSQVPAFFGSARAGSQSDWLGGVHLSNLATVAVGVATCAAMLRAPRLTRKVPGVVVGLAAGSALYYLLKGLGLGDHLGPLIGAIPPLFSGINYAPDFLALTTGSDSRKVLPILVSSAFSLAIISSLDALLCSKVMESITRIRSQGNLELGQQGAGNMVSALVGGLPSSVNLAASTANFNAGGRTRLSLLVSSGLILVSMAVLGPVIAYIPRVVVAGLLIVTAIRLVDRWTLGALKKMASGQFAQLRSIAVDLVVVALVALVAVFANIVMAVAIGIGVAVVFFILRMSRSIVRRVYTGESVHSREVRSARDMQILQEHGAGIKVFELEGPVFFGSAENLSARIDSDRDADTAILILDLKRVTQIDSTGAVFLVQMNDRLQRDGKLLLLAHVRDNPLVARELHDLGVASAVSQSRMFEDTDRAIEYAEDQLLLSYSAGAGAIDAYPFQQIEILSGFEEAELEVLKRALVERTYASGDWIFREGDPGDELFLLAKGRASVRIRLPGDRRETRLVSFGPGTVFGEMALLDRETRSAGLQADEDVLCYVLPLERFRQLNRDHPAIAIKLLTNLGRELSFRLRRATRTIVQLET